MKKKTPKDSMAITTEIVLPNDTNTLGNLMGGRLLHWMDITAAIACHRHCNRIVVTASVNNVAFNQAIVGFMIYRFQVFEIAGISQGIKIDNRFTRVLNNPGTNKL